MSSEDTFLSLPLSFNEFFLLASSLIIIIKKKSRQRTSVKRRRKGKIRKFHLFFVVGM